MTKIDMKLGQNAMHLTEQSVRTASFYKLSAARQVDLSLLADHQSRVSADVSDRCKQQMATVTSAQGYSAA